MPNCSNLDFLTDEEYKECVWDYIFPSALEWVLIASHGVIFVAGLLGNALVCIAVYRNHTMRTVTNYFIVNLAVADFLVILLCLPFTVVWDITETWFLGLALCKTVPYLQTVSVTVSILTLTFISIDRWYAICFPLDFKTTTGRAKTAIIGIWAVALLFDIPELVVLHVTPPRHLRVKMIVFTQCSISWSSESQITFTVIKLIFHYIGPLIFMSVAYWQIIRVLWRNNIPGHNLPARASQLSQTPPSGGGNPEGQLRSRRKAAKMLVTVVITFAICFFPVHVFSIIRYTIKLPSSKTMNSVTLIIHGLCYFNSAVNPLIYNFMSGKFRKEFRRSFRCTRGNDSRFQRGYLASSSNLPRINKSRTTTTRITSKNNNNVQRNTEIIPLSAITTDQQNEKHE
ncbi:orexin receptor type 2-like [Hylaeus anthracinus]|uniref:orexin receptor type 2-like n=1 Tax=Hylaeus anthracinus TaxID=313031 RepID=UPI0023B8902B|nr:orexin receptor type 2-like [Hylaeus anthracinus]XP_054003913.1 orexin receptor type 2-like [Hylaeus anthracinus]XP_054003914.1 orexin receptor type 2-like [Hylaeus anthracinus]XP_054003915.1 orexin receptor type 2-like [Hylaeus anthracinus]